MTRDASTADARVPRVRGPLRGAILKRAADLASLDGLEQITIGRLAASMEMSKSGLYAYFTSKENLQLATIDCAWRIFEERVLEPGDDPFDALLERWISYYEDETFPGGCPFVTAGTEFANRDGRVHDALAAAIQRQLTALEQGVARAFATQLLTDADATQLAFELHAVLTAGNQRFRISRDHAAFAHARTAIRRLLAADPPRPASLASAAAEGDGMATAASPALRRADDTQSELLAIDHVALSVADPGAMEAFLCDFVGMQELARTGDGVLVGADPRAVKLRLLAAQGPREPAALARLALRVADPQAAAASLPAENEVQESAPDLVAFDGPEGLGLAFTSVAGGGIDRDVDHLVLRVADPDETRIALADVGFVERGTALLAGATRILLEELPAWSERPLLHQIAIRVRSTAAIAARARARGLEVVECERGAGVTLILPGLEQIRLEFVTE
ncbi:MAG: TetR family transcriptional regulator C-terminal domain-containing protein [Thermoleophilia bacterium]